MKRKIRVAKYCPRCGSGTRLEIKNGRLICPNTGCRYSEDMPMDIQMRAEKRPSFDDLLYPKDDDKDQLVN